MLLFESDKKQTKQKLHARHTEFQAIVLCGYGNRYCFITPKLFEHIWQKMHY
jgi:hypothetical protein